MLPFPPQIDRRKPGPRTREALGFSLKTKGALLPTKEASRHTNGDQGGPGWNSTLSPACTLPMRRPSSAAGGLCPGKARPLSVPSGGRPGKTRPSSSAGNRTRQMDADPLAYWNSQAKGYDDNIVSSIDEDHTGIIRRTLDAFAQPHAEGPSGRCIDLGCGAGKYLSALASRFKSVKAYDLSPKLVDVAKKLVQGRALHDVEVRVRDLSVSWSRQNLSVTSDANSGQVEDDESGRYGFAVMANVMIAPGCDAVLMLRNAFRVLCPAGRLMVVVPSLESALYVGKRCEDVNFVGPYVGKSVSAELLQGIFKRFGVKTKHFLEVEFRFAATQAGFAVEACNQVTYSWTAELSLDTDAELPPALRKPSPLPWDWLFVLKKAVPDSSDEG